MQDCWHSDYSPCPCITGAVILDLPPNLGGGYIFVKVELEKLGYYGFLTVAAKKKVMPALS